MELILIVDDDADSRDATAMLLEHLGHSTLAAEDGPGALAMLDANPAIRVLITDIMMPGGLTGFQLAQRARRRHPGLGIVFVTGYTPEQFPESGLSGSPMLVKPWGIAQIEEAIQRCTRA